ncbi:MAG: MFS transporter [Deltaproteobacteria bacterium]|nr:MFS transporter [Deltaproteobacteria bacterium]
MKPLTSPTADVAAASSSPRPRKWLNRNVAGMGLTSLLSDAGHESATAVLPAFLSTIGASAAALGVIEGVADAVASFIKLGAGWYSDRVGQRKPITVAGYFLTGVSTGTFAFAWSWPLVLVGRVLGWFGRGVRGPLRDAILSESVAQEDTGKAFGFHRAGDTLGAILGPLLAVLIIGYLESAPLADPSWPFRLVFLLTVIPGVGSALAFALMVKEQRRPANHELRFWASLRALPRSYKRFLVGVGIFGLGDFAHTLLILRATELLTPQFGVTHAAQLAALLFTARNVFYALASYPVGALSDVVGRRGLLALGYFSSAVMCLGFLLPISSLWYLGVLFALAGTYIAVEDALEGATAADLLPPEIRGIGYGVLGTVNGLGDLFSSIIVGLLWTHVTSAAGFGYAAVLSLTGALLILRVR